MKLFIAITFYVLNLSLCLAGEPHTFTSKDGRKLEGEVQSATDTDVTIRTKDGRQLTLNYTLISDEDVTWVKEWKNKANAPKKEAEPADPVVLGPLITFSLKGKSVSGHCVDVNDRFITILTPEAKRVKVKIADLQRDELMSILEKMRSWLDKQK